jgi:hypothetical protein
MSKFPTIPEFVKTPEEMGTALRAVKISVEILAGLRQGESKGAPQMFVQTTTPSPANKLSYKIGDLWINTSTNKLNYWTGSAWQAFA